MYTDFADNADYKQHPDCVACLANAGQITAPGGLIYEDALWRLEHILIPRQPNLPEELRGPRVFDLLRRATEGGLSVPDAEAAAMAQAVRSQL